MKFIKSVNESFGKEYYILWYVNEDLNVDILGIFEDKKDMDIFILNYANAELREVYDMIEVKNEEDEEDEDDLDAVDDYTKEKDENEYYIFIEPNQALQWINNRGHNHIQNVWELGFQRKKMEKPVLDGKIKEYMEIKKYNL
jgi:hypothetical protein